MEKLGKLALLFLFIFAVAQLSHTTLTDGYVLHTKFTCNRLAYFNALRDFISYEGVQIMSW